MHSAAVRGKLLLLLRMAAQKATAEEEEEQASLQEDNALVGEAVAQVRAWPDMQKKLVLDMLHGWYPKYLSTFRESSSISWAEHQRRVALGISPGAPRRLHLSRGGSTCHAVAPPVTRRLHLSRGGSTCHAVAPPVTRWLHLSALCWRGGLLLAAGARPH